jgi:hypothetical protein
MLSGQDDISTPHIYKRTRLMSYKDSINPLMNKKVHNLRYLLQIYFQSLFLKYHCLFSKKDTCLSIKSLEIHRKDILHLSTTSHIVNENKSHC